MLTAIRHLTELPAGMAGNIGGMKLASLPTRLSSQLGYTLLELMTALSILGILVAIGAPSFNEYTRNSRTLAAQNDFVTALNLARNEAVRRSMRVTVCASSNGANCTGNTTWNNGWIVFQDGSGAMGTVDANDRVLQVYRDYPAAIVDIPAATALGFYSFTSTGTAAQAGVLEMQPHTCPTGVQKRRQVTVVGIGSIRSQLINCT
ncbi:MAG TPA: GspH/FimT family pseudopilin [Steroidobacteraceae bacterium]|nr:GspH/FimT family pseudopilin [Steroidobacteraceae bacterium]